MIDKTIHTPTAGEKRVYNLLQKLPRKEFSFEYEPQINTADGHSSKPDFIVVSARLGVVVIEVKDWRTLTGGDQTNIQIIHTDGTPGTYPNPARTVDQYAYHLKNRFEERAELWETYKGRHGLKFPWQVMVVLPFVSQQVIEKFEKKGIWTRNVVIGAEKLAHPELLEQAIHQLPWRFKLDHPLSLDMLDLIREMIYPHLRINDADGHPIGTVTRSQEKLINEPARILEPQQNALFADSGTPETPPEPYDLRLVRGVAGSGKTLVLVRRARALAERYPGARILVMAFNKDLAADLKARIDLPDDSVQVTNFHKLCYEILKPIWAQPLNKGRWLKQHAAEEIEQLDLPMDFLEEELAWRLERGLTTDAAYLNADRRGRGYSLTEARRTLINQIFNRYEAHKQMHEGSWFDWDDVGLLTAKALESHPLRGSYDAILIDEAQDFAPSWMAVTRLLLKPGGTLFICDDPSQSIFHSYSWVQKGLNVSGRSVVLKVPFRSTREISQLAHSLIEADEELRQVEERPIPDFTSYELGSGEWPLLTTCSDEAAEVQLITQRVERLLQKTSAQQIAILCPEKYRLDQWAALKKQGVYVKNFEGMKGLEFNIVFIPHLDRLFAPEDDAETISAKRRKLFAAITRARYQLSLTSQQELPAPLTPILSYVHREETEVH